MIPNISVQRESTLETTAASSGFQCSPSSGSTSSTTVVSQEALSTLGASVCRALINQDYENKKRAARGIENIIRVFQEKDVATTRTKAIIEILVNEFLKHPDNRDAQVGGSIALVGAARGLGANIKLYLSAVVEPVLQICSSTDDITVRYYTAEVRGRLLEPAVAKC